MSMNKGKAKELLKRALKKDDIEEINRIILEYPALIEEFGLDPYKWLDTENAVICALGIQEDELSGPARADDVVKSVIIDLRKNVSDIEVYSILDRLERQQFIQRRGYGYVLTAKGVEICDDTLSKISI
ncbi:MAG TPA: hypothetical protein VMV49_00175 [Candidatus Deferrimicrobium sp.]|nr:hypothetical protein [Candidatus Deferrimicrobium sp.]